MTASAEELEAARARLRAVLDRATPREPGRLAEVGLHLAAHDEQIEQLGAQFGAITEAMRATLQYAGLAAPEQPPPRDRHGMHLVRPPAGDVA